MLLFKSLLDSLYTKKKIFNKLKSKILCDQMALRFKDLLFPNIT